MRVRINNLTNDLKVTKQESSAVKPTLLLESNKPSRVSLQSRAILEDDTPLNRTCQIAKANPDLYLTSSQNRPNFIEKNI